RLWETASGRYIQELKGYSDWVTSAAFSPDGTQVASASRDQTVRLWETASGRCLQILNIGTTLSSIAFDSTNSLLTNIGYINVSLSSAVREASLRDADITSYQSITSEQHQALVRVGVGLSSDGSWVTLDGRRIVWLPPEVRLSESAILGKTVVLGSRSGRVTIIGFSVDISPF
ncbi:WD40-repeat-containing domain protein, partial [Lasiosphaeria miniovina]